MQHNFSIYFLNKTENYEVYKRLEILTFELPEALGLSSFLKNTVKCSIRCHNVTINCHV